MAGSGGLDFDKRLDPINFALSYPPPKDCTASRHVPNEGQTGCKCGLYRIERTPTTVLVWFAREPEPGQEIVFLDFGATD